MIEILRGNGPEDLRELCRELAAWMLYLGGRAATIVRAKQLSDELIQSGQALEKFREMVALQGGDPRAIDNTERLPRARHALDILSSQKGYVSAIECEAVGTACVVLGGGREKKEDSVDPSVGIILHKKVADRVDTGEPLCTIRYNDEGRAANARQLLMQSYQIADSPPVAKKLVRRIILGTDTPQN